MGSHLGPDIANKIADFTEMKAITDENGEAIVCKGSMVICDNGWSKRNFTADKQGKITPPSFSLQEMVLVSSKIQAVHAFAYAEDARATVYTQVRHLTFSIISDEKSFTATCSLTQYFIQFCLVTWLAYLT